LNAAYSVLRDASSRKDYDRRRTNGYKPEQPHAERPNAKPVEPRVAPDLTARPQADLSNGLKVGLFLLYVIVLMGVLARGVYIEIRKDASKLIRPDGEFRSDDNSPPLNIVDDDKVAVTFDDEIPARTERVNSIAATKERLKFSNPEYSLGHSEKNA
jgi:hypothetical protein